MRPVGAVRALSTLLSAAFLAWAVSCVPLASLQDDLGGGTSPPPTKDNFLELFRAAEHAALADSHFVGRATFPAGPIFRGEGRATYAVAFSAQGSVSARTMRLDGMPKNVSYIAPPAEGSGAFSAPSYFDGDMVFWVLEEMAVIRGVDRNDLLEATEPTWCPQTRASERPSGYGASIQRTFRRTRRKSFVFSRCNLRLGGDSPSA